MPLGHISTGAVIPAHRPWTRTLFRCFGLVDASETTERQDSDKGRGEGPDRAMRASIEQVSQR